MVEVLSEEVVFDIVVILEEIQVEIGETGGLGDNQDRDKVEEELDQIKVLDQDQIQELVQMETE